MRRQLRERLQDRVARELAPRADGWTDLRTAVDDLERACNLASSDLDRAAALVGAITAAHAARHRRFTPDMTVHAAWAHHPGVAGIFTARHLPACPDCAVGADETLAEAAFGYALDLDDLLEQLNALLGEAPDAAGP